MSFNTIGSPSLEGHGSLARGKAITLRLAMECALTPEELIEHDKLSTDQAFERVAAVKSLHLEWRDVNGISNLEPFENLRFLFLEYNRIERIEGLDFQFQLQFLALQNNRIRVVEHLQHLEQLAFVDLSHNLIGHLDVQELPKSIAILLFVGNACVDDPGYTERLVSWLPKLEDLDGRTLQGEASAFSSSGFDDEVALADGPGEGALTAYWQRDKLQAGIVERVQAQISSYSAEAFGDVDHFGTRIERAIERSAVRRRQDSDGSHRHRHDLESSLRLNSSLSKSQMEEIKRRSAHLVAKGSTTTLVDAPLAPSPSRDGQENES